MLTQSNGKKSLILFAPTSRDLRDDFDQLDKAGQTILQLLDSAAGVAEKESNRRVLAKAQKLSHQLHAAEDRIAELEAEVASHQAQAERAEQWLQRVYIEIEDRFLRQQQNARRGASQRQISRTKEFFSLPTGSTQEGAASAFPGPDHPRFGRLPNAMIRRTVKPIFQNAIATMIPPRWAALCGRSPFPESRILTYPQILTH